MQAPHFEKETGCIYCGNNPVSHRASFITQSILVAGLPFAVLFSFLLRPFFQKIIHRAITAWNTESLEIIGLARFSKDIEKVCGGRSRVIWEEARARGIVMEQMVLGNKYTEQFRAKMHGKMYYFMSLPIPPYLDQRAYLWIDSKVALKKFFMKHNIAVPKGGAACTWASAQAIWTRIEKPVIVKPANGSRGRHSLTHLTTEADLRHGYTIARQLCCSVVIEEHLRGSVYRATYVGGEIAGVLRGDPPRITGDGVTTVRALITQKNATRPKEVHEVEEKQTVEECLLRQGYTYDTILEKDKRIDLLEKIGLSYGGDAVEDFPLAHPKLLAELKRAGDLLNIPLVGFDFISEDITKDPDTVRWGIIEANSMPFIDLHHDPRAGTPINVAAKVWDLWDKK
jgi:D-alanine-D-alanine ligase-like ATP-grasp enzyme